jgi:hypothetical protein
MLLSNPRVHQRKPIDIPAPRSMNNTMTKGISCVKDMVYS